MSRNGPSDSTRNPPRSRPSRGVRGVDAARIERQLAAAQQITHIGSWEWNAESGIVTWSDELYRIYGLEPQKAAITFDWFLGRLHPDDRERVRGEVTGTLTRGGRFAYLERVFHADGTLRWLDTVGEAAHDESGRVIGLIGTCRDVTKERERERLETAEQALLEMIASGAALEDVLTRIVFVIEEQSPGTLGSILLLDPNGKQLRHGAAPRLPDAYNRAVDGAAIGPKAGSCGTAAFLRTAVIVTDIETDPLWSDYKGPALAAGLKACWSTPILAKDGRVLGTFALYYQAPRSPTDHDLRLIARATHMAGIAIERSQLEEQLRALTAHAERVREEERSAIAREVHDELGQTLTAFKLDLAWLRRRLSSQVAAPPEVLLEKIAEMSQMTDEVINRVRRISAELRPGLLDHLGLLAALEWQAEEFEKRTGTRCEVESNLGERRLDRELTTTVFRIFQEALTNVARHAQATRVDVRLTLSGGRLELWLHDDGVGISPVAEKSPTSLGLLGIRERARRLGGSVSVTRADGGGTTLELSLPAPPAEGQGA